MKKIVKSKVILITLIVLVCILTLSTLSYATDTLNVITDPNAALNANNNLNQNINNSLNQNTDNNLNQNTSLYNNTNNNTTKLPQTGIEDSALWLIIPVCVASALYAYKKIRDYNI